MMRTRPVDWSLGPILAGGLTLAHYECFAGCASLPALKTRLADQWPAHREFGVHVLVSQHDRGELVLGDSHEYDDAITPFDKPAIDALVLAYLRTLVDAGDFSIAERWHGIYVKHPHEPYCVFAPDAGVTAVAALGGHGMTLSFGLAEQVVSQALG
jgi:glycine/D-amino acid oxidase-like deaminating enzyme